MSNLKFYYLMGTAITFFTIYSSSLNAANVNVPVANAVSNSPPPVSQSSAPTNTPSYMTSPAGITPSGTSPQATQPSVTISPPTERDMTGPRYGRQQ